MYIDSGGVMCGGCANGGALARCGCAGGGALAGDGRLSHQLSSVERFDPSTNVAAMPTARSAFGAVMI